MDPVRPKLGSNPTRSHETLEKLALFTTQLKTLIKENSSASKHVEDQKLKLKMYLTSINAIECASKQLQVFTKSVQTLKTCDDSLKNACKNLQQLTETMKDAHYRKEYKDALKLLAEADRYIQKNEEKNNLVVGFVVEDYYDSKIWSFVEQGGCW